jgi:hypothetical protein
MCREQKEKEEVLVFCNNCGSLAKISACPKATKKQEEETWKSDM